MCYIYEKDIDKRKKHCYDLGTKNKPYFTNAQITCEPVVKTEKRKEEKMSNE